MKDLKEIVLDSEIKGIKGALDGMQDVANQFINTQKRMKSLIDTWTYESKQRQQIEIDGGLKYKNGEFRGLDSGFEVSIKMNTADARKLAYQILAETE